MLTSQTTRPGSLLVAMLQATTRMPVALTPPTDSVYPAGCSAAQRHPSRLDGTAPRDAMTRT